MSAAPRRRARSRRSVGAGRGGDAMVGCAPGMVLTADGTLHVNLTQLLEENGWPANEHNLSMVASAAAELLPVQFPGADIEIQP